MAKPTHLIGLRLDDPTLAKLDQVKGPLSRAAFCRNSVLGSLYPQSTPAEEAFAPIIGSVIVDPEGQLWVTTCEHENGRIDLLKVGGDPTNPENYLQNTLVELMVNK